MSAIDVVVIVGLALVAVLLTVVLARLRGAGAGQVPALEAQLGLVRESVAQQGEALAQIRERLAAAGALDSQMQSGLSQARALLERMTAQHETVREAQERAREMLRRLEAVLIGGYETGRAGENVVAQTLRCFPPEMVQSDVALGGRRVEFALVMCDGRLLAIDSKWPATDLLTRLADEQDPREQQRLREEVEQQVARRVREVAGYVDAERTLPWAVAAVPDAAFAACRSAHAQARERGVVIIPYGMLVPYLLTLYNLHLRYATGADAAQTRARLVEMGRLLDSLERTLEGKLYRANTMLANACAECSQCLAALRTCVSGALGADEKQPPAAQPTAG